MGTIRAARCLLLLALLLGSASWAAAQVAPSLDVSLAPTGATVTAGERAATLVTVRNDGAAPVVVAMSSTGNLSVAFSNATMTVPGGGTATSVATVSSAATDAPGAYNVTILATVPATGTTASARFDVTLVAPPPPNGSRAAPPTLGPALQRAHAAAGEIAVARLTVGNPDNATRTYNVSVQSSRGWNATPYPVSFDVAGGASREVGVSFAPDGSAASGHAIVTVTGVGGSATAEVDLALDAPQPTPTPTPTPTPIPTITPTPGPTPEPTPTPPPTSDPSPTPPPATPPRVRVEPTEVLLALDAPGRATLVVEGNATGSVTLALALPDTLRATLPGAVELVPGAPLEVPFEISLARPITVGSTFSLAVRVDGVAAPFQARVVAATPTTQANAAVKSADAPAPRVGGFVVAGVAIAAAAAVALATRRRWAPLLVALYARLRPGAVQAHPIRARMLETVRATPGITFGELQRRLGLRNGQMAHHVLVLERARLLVSAPDGQLRRLYLPGATRAAPTGGIGERALDLLRARGAMPASLLARELGVSRQALRYHLDKLEKAQRIRLRLGLRGLQVELSAP